MAEPANLAFTDISVEEWREYRFPGGETVRIKEPTRLHVSASGGHRVEDATGHGHYVPPGWIHLHWKAKDGEPIFVR